MSSQFTSTSSTYRNSTYPINNQQDLNEKLDTCLDLLKQQQQTIDKQQQSLSIMNVMMKTMLVQVAHVSNQKLNAELMRVGNVSELSSATKRSFGSNQGEKISALHRNLPFALLRPIPDSTMALLPAKKIDPNQNPTEEPESESESESEPATPASKRSKSNLAEESTNQMVSKVIEPQCIGKKDPSVRRKVRCLLCVHYHKIGSDQANRTNIYCERCSEELGAKIFICNSSKCWERHRDKILQGPTRILRRLEKLREANKVKQTSSTGTSSSKPQTLSIAKAVAPAAMFNTNSSTSMVQRDSTAAAENEDLSESEDESNQNSEKIPRPADQHDQDQSESEISMDA